MFEYLSIKLPVFHINFGKNNLAMQPPGTGFVDGFCVTVREDVHRAISAPLLRKTKDITKDRTPIFAKGNRFLGIPLNRFSQFKS